MTKELIVPAKAVGVLNCLDARIKALQQVVQAAKVEQAALIEAGRVYAASVGIDPSGSYTFEPQPAGDGMVATKVQPPSEKPAP